MNGDEPAVRDSQQNLFVAMADPVEEKLLHMVTADPAGRRRSRRSRRATTS